MANLNFYRKGFTLLEALAAAALLAVGVTASLGALGAITKTEDRARQKELVQRLAMEKYDELISTNQQPVASQTGDFSDRNIPGYTWNFEVDPSGVTNLDTVKMTVQKQMPSATDVEGIVQGMIYIPPSSTTTITAGTG